MLHAIQNILGVNSIKKLLISLSVILLACNSITPAQELKEKNTLIEGKLLSCDKDEKNRVFIYLETDNGIISGVLYNKFDNNIIVDLYQVLHTYPKDKTLILYGQETKGQYEEILEGIDYEIIGVNFYEPRSDRYLLVQVTYKKTTKEAMKDISFKTLFNIGFDLFKKLM